MEPRGEDYSDWHLMGTVVGRGGEDPPCLPCFLESLYGTLEIFL